MKMKQGFVLGAVFGLATTQMALADPTALQLAKSGDEYVGSPSRDRVLEIYSERSVARMEPNIWHVVYYDPSVMSKSIDVKFGAGQEMDVSHPVHPFVWAPKANNILDQSKLRVDSDRALHMATSQPLLNGLTLRTSKMTLENSDDGVVWNVELFAAKTGDPSKEASIGTVCISANDGSLIKSDLHPSSVN